MATFSRGVAASALTLALAAPSIVVPQGIAEDIDTAAATTTASSPAAEPTVIDWNTRHDVTFSGDAPAVVSGFTLPAGATVKANLTTIFNWGVEANEDGSVVLSRPSADVSFTEGSKDVAVTVNLPDGKEIKNALKVNVSKRPEDALESDPDLARRYETENFWNQDSAAIKGLEVDPNYTFAPTANTIFNWGFSNDNGTLVVKRPESAASFKTGDVSIPVNITRGDGSSYTSTLNLSVIDEMPKAEWEDELPDFGGVYDVDFEGNVTKVVEELALPEGVTVKKNGIGSVGWNVATKDGKIQVTAPNNFIPGTFTIPVVFSDGTSEVERTLRISAKNPATPSGTIADIAADFIGKVGGGLLGGLTGGAGGAGGGGLNIFSNNGNPNVIITDNAKAEIKDNLSNNGNPIITDNAKATVEIKDNLSNNGNPDVKISENVKISDNAKATVEIKDNLSNNGNPDVKISDNAKATVVITDNAKAEVKDNANNNGNPDVKISDNANPTVVITDNAKAEVKDNANNNGNPDVKISDNAKATVVITDNAKVDANNNGNPDVKVEGIPGSSGGSSKQDSLEVDPDMGVYRGSTDPRCIATLVGIGLPLLAIIPLALSTQLAVPGLGKQLNDVLKSTARSANVPPEALTGIGGGVLGLVAAIIAIAGGQSCTSPAQPAPVVPTDASEEE